MQNVSETFNQKARGAMRRLARRVLISFEKVLDEDIDLFTIGTSTIGGGDFMPGTGSVAQEWDKYIYEDFTDRIISLEWQRSVDFPYSVSMAIADIVLNNFDDYFTPGSGSEIDASLKPFRPIRIYAGFGDEVVPVFVGLTDGMAVIDEKKKTASFHCIDFLSSLLERPLNQSVLLLNKNTAEILDEVFQMAGILPTQLNLDTGLNIVPYFFLPKGTKLGETVRKLMQAEQGRLFMDENGIITFKNRQDYSDSAVYNFDAYTNIIDYKDVKTPDIINVVEVNGQKRQVLPKQPYYIQSVETYQPAILVPANSEKEIWIDFPEPVTTADDPEPFGSATTSTFTVNTAEDGTGDVSLDVTLQSSDLFAQSMKLVFDNPTADDLYIIYLSIYATPVVVTQKIYVREQIDSSVDDYEEQLLTIDNEFIQSEDSAQARALSIINDWSDFGGVAQLTVQGNMALQLDDTVRVDVFGRADNYKIWKSVNKISIPARYTQVLNVRKFEPFQYFSIGGSLIGGDDVLSP